MTWILLLVGTMGLGAQELNCNVQINSDQVEGTNKQAFNTLQQSVTEFLNNSNWTDMTYASEERIDCSMTIIVATVEDNLYTCEMQVQVRRPVYGTTYFTPLLNFRDEKFVFSYAEFDQLEYQQNVFTTNLTAMLAYYAYVIIGLDMDSFGRYGGTPYFRMAESIVNTCQIASMGGSEQSGWKAFEKGNRNRYSLINNILDENFKNYRDYMYSYHRLAFDVMATNVTNARAKIAEGLPVVRECNRNRPGSVLVSTFMDTKVDELVQLFADGTSEEKELVAELLMDIDPTRSQAYEDLVN